ncbi:methyltransferase domain-containing protein [Streptomyces sp. NPDC005805]|uniref:methyltransferase domain-containing protein n=1 Tax=Streptomyces sp. NPDC005805 TaxID=3157068 RepID=UPI0033C036F4
MGGERPGLGRSPAGVDPVSVPEWADAYRAVPRGPFLPDVIWPHDMESGTTIAVDRVVEPAMWQGYMEADCPIVTQWDDGAGDAREPGTAPTSSASMPSVVLRMLDELDARPGHRVLEIGSGTGWNAALLAHRLGADRVVTVEVDARVAERARTSLEAFGLPVRVVTGDGVLGWADGAPYDRIVATAGVRDIPVAWLRQTRPGGVLLAPWGTHFGHHDALVRLVVADDGLSATGRFTGPVQFMKLRAQRTSFAGHGAYVPDGVGGAERSSAEVSEQRLLGDGPFAPLLFAIGLRVRAMCHQPAAKRDGARPVWFYGLDENHGHRSWACVMLRDGHEHADVWQSGPRRLWDEVREALEWWESQGRPGYDRFGLTVSATEGQRAWLDDPSASWER